MDIILLIVICSVGSVVFWIIAALVMAFFTSHLQE